MNKVTEIQRTKVCKVGKGSDCCSFLVYTPDGFECAKGTSLEPQIINQRFLEIMTAMGDNCSGPPEFKPNEE